MSKILFIPGFLGEHHEGDFLNPLFPHILSVDYRQIPPKNYSKAITELINKERPDSLYAYSLGGRILHSLFDDLIHKPRHIFIESSQLLPADTPDSTRFQLDQKRAQDIRANFPLFLKNWYSAKLWSFTSKEREQMIAKKLKYWQHHVSCLSEALLHYCPAKFMAPPNSTLLQRSLGQARSELTYFYGEYDLKYKDQAQKLAHRGLKIHEMPGCGHNIHFQAPQKLLEQCQQRWSATPHAKKRG